MRSMNQAEYIGNGDYHPSLTEYNQLFLEGSEPYSCQICFDEKPKAELAVLDCEAHHYFCADCSRGHIKSQVEDGRSKVMKCPFPDCGHTIGIREVKRIFASDKALIDKYSEFMLQALLTESDAVRCINPTGCEYAMIADEGDKHIRCHLCNYEFCRECKVDWHAGSTCAQYREWEENNANGDTKNAQWLKANTRPCPSCKTPIEKNDGCNHMTCKNAGCKPLPGCRSSAATHQFCWVCMGPYGDNHMSYSGNDPSNGTYGICLPSQQARDAEQAQEGRSDSDDSESDDSESD